MDNKNTIKQLFLSLALCFFVVSLHAQKASPIGLSPNNFPKLKFEKIPAIPYAGVEKRDQDNNWQDRVSIPTNVKYNTENTGQWHELDNGDRVWRKHFQCENAKGMAFMFKQFTLPVGARLDVYSPDGKHVLDSYMTKDVNPKGSLIAGPIAGTDVILEYYEPASVKGQGSFDLFSIQRMYKNVFPRTASDNPQRDFGDAWECHVNVNCLDTDYFEDAERSVVRILMTMEEGLVYCSGSLINNTAQDMIPYILTAFHCASDLTPIYDFYRFDFNFTSPFCTDPGQAPSFQSLLGCAHISGYADSDFELLRIFQSIPSSYNAYFSGWNRTQDYRPDTTTLIHHPNGDVKKIAQEHSRVIIFNSTIDWNNDLVTSPRTHYRGFLDIGAFQAGSSGSPLLDNEGNIVGQLHGGDALCNDAKTFCGRLAVSWTGGGATDNRLREWLDPINAGNLVQAGFDANNANAVSSSISGRILDVKGGPMINATVYVNSNGDYPRSTSAIVDSTVTDITGNFVFENLPMGSDYFVSASNNNCIRDGLSVSDITRVIRHLLHEQRFTEPEQYIVADVNNDGSVSVNDALFVRFLLLALIEKFPNQESYMILRSDTVFEEENPIQSDWQQGALIFRVDNLSGPALVPDFVAYKVGDSTLSNSGCIE